MKTIQEIQADIVQDFAALTDWMDKYEYLIELGKEMPLIDEKDKTEDKLIRGCQSRVWLSCRAEDGRLRFAADSDAIITKGIISLLLRVYDGQTPADILVSMIATIKAYAATFREAPAAPATPADGKGGLEDDIVLALRQVYDPEIPVNVYDLGLIYDVQADADGQVFIKMTLTAPNCPIADDVVAQVREAVADVPGVKDVEVELVFEPEWTTDRMSEEAKLELGML